jgi:ribosome biogenesis GTPase
MSNQQSGLEKLGWNKWFEGLSALQCRPIETVARVAAVDRDQLFLLNDTRAHFGQNCPAATCIVTGYRKSFPAWATGCAWRKAKTMTSVLFMRFSTAKQVSAARRQGGAIEFQMIAANVDYVIIVQSCHFDFNLKRLERYLVMVMDGGAEPYVLLTKTDLIEPDILAAQLSQMRTAGVATPVLTLSNVTREGIDELKRIFLPGKTYCFVGSSGVGKSTIVNELIGQTCSKQRTSALQARAGTLLSAGN